MPLTATEIRNLKRGDKPYKRFDEKGLYLEVMPNGVKRWRFKYRRPGSGKENLLGFGRWPETSLKEARRQRDKCRDLLAEDIDPGQARKMEKQKRKELSENSFQAAAQDWKAHHLENKSESHRKRTWGMLERCVFPYIGHRPITDGYRARRSGRGPHP